MLRAQSAAQGFLLRADGELKEAYQQDKRALEIGRRVIGDQHETSLYIFNSFGADLRARGDFVAAKEHDKTSLRMHEAVFGDEHPLTLGVMNNLSLDYGAFNSDIPAAPVNLHQACMSRCRARPRKESARQMSYAHGLNLSAVRLCGDYGKARFLGEDALDFGRQELGADHPLTLLTGKDLSIALRAVRCLR